MKQGFISLFTLLCLLLMEAVILMAGLFFQGNAEQTLIGIDGIKACYLAESGLNLAAVRLSESDFAAATARTEFAAQPDITISGESGTEMRVYIKGNAAKREVLAVGQAGAVSRELSGELLSEGGSFKLDKVYK